MPPVNLPIKITTALIVCALSVSCNRKDDGPKRHTLFRASLDNATWSLKVTRQHYIADTVTRVAIYNADGLRVVERRIDDKKVFDDIRVYRRNQDNSVVITNGISALAVIDPENLSIKVVYERPGEFTIESQGSRYTIIDGEDD